MRRRYVMHKMCAAAVSLSTTAFRISCARQAFQKNKITKPYVTRWCKEKAATSLSLESFSMSATRVVHFFADDNFLLPCFISGQPLPFFLLAASSPSPLFLLFATFPPSCVLPLPMFFLFFWRLSSPPFPYFSGE